MNQSMWMFLVVIVLLVGVNTLIWGTAGLCRVIARETMRRSDARRARQGLPQIVRSTCPPVTAEQVAIVIAAHNEELVLAQTLSSAGRQVPMNQVFVISDGSSDGTARLAAEAGAQVLELNPNRGKAGAIVAGVEHFELSRRFEVVLLLDADTQLADDYLETGLPLFTDDDVVSVAGRATTLFKPGARSLFGRFLVSYRERVYIVVQLLIKYGQAARSIDCVTIVPGFASMYRSRVLGHIDIAAPGLTIEDYNMTFEIHARSLGRIAFHPYAAIAKTQDPDNFHDYVKQVGRWSLGFWQTVLRHPWQPRKFWFALYLYIAELVISSLLVVLIVPLVLLAALGGVLDALGWDQMLLGVDVAVVVPPGVLLLGFVLPDYLLTVFAACVARRPSFLLFGLAFPLLRIVDSALCLHRLPEAVVGESTGAWTSPSRRTAELPVHGRRAREHV
ncbi:glycosyltransferase family 2 protein [Subtercola endophyticus]|uniref:glycosyltransferase family 2 protein n=1 Tax=Subtercola endophyticus TaxID=2895559 RepID=UPI001E46D18D|nr:glycosyltransferase family 2 protein [Subtercola endophyticus]UFS60247.1 glycosyltransferase family 2 protein [Subtercola endophyticus]